MYLASFEYPPTGVPFIMVVTLVGLAAFWIWRSSPSGTEWWRHPLVVTFTVLGALTVLFMAWASATG